MNKQKYCVPQWGATKPSKACTFCAGQKKTCKAMDEFLRQVDQLRPDQVGQHRCMSSALFRPFCFRAHSCKAATQAQQEVDDGTL